ncbi:hypothetical protein DPMN_088601 [Dreissena polymorpha]|uniref:Claudin n=1 Tax=Dreissena polymorpha TaxID=45954 RepID=A0A9D4QWJ2_DREPO|nr:hypothetical protein DPMN_088601 [Dreissena polymorpha]
MSCVSHCLGRLCVALKIIALITNITALGLPYWYKGSPTTSSGVDGSNTVETTIREGLWKKCTDLEYVSSSNSFCEDNEGRLGGVLNLTVELNR